MFAGVRGGAALGSGVVLGLVLATATAHAHPLLDRARERYNDADFAAALRQLDRAEAASDLTRQDVLALLELRAVVRLAMEDTAGMQADLARLVSIAPDHRLGDDAPPEARQALDAARRASPGPLAIGVVVEPQPGGVSLAPDVRNDGSSVVREVRVMARVPGGRWESATDGVLVIQLGEAGAVEYHAVAIGPGGAAVATLGSEAAPERWVAPRRAGSARPARERDRGSEGGGGGGAWLWIAGGVGVAAVAVVVVLLATSSRAQPETEVGFPMVVAGAGAP